MNDSVHVRLLSDISDKVLEVQSAMSREEDSFWDFGGWKECDSPKKHKTNSDCQDLGTKPVIELRKRSLSKLQQSKSTGKPAKLDKPLLSPFLLFPLPQSSVSKLPSPCPLPRTAVQVRQPQPSPKQKLLSLRAMMTKQVRQVISITEETHPIHSGKNRPSLSDGREGGLALPRIATRQVIRRAETRLGGSTSRPPVLFL